VKKEIATSHNPPKEKIMFGRKKKVVKKTSQFDNFKTGLSAGITSGTTLLGVFTGIGIIFGAADIALSTAKKLTGSLTARVNAHREQGS